jgi:hypothetical protein
MQGEDLGRQNCIVAQANGCPLWFITDNEDRTTEKLKSLGYQVTDRTVLTYRVKTGAQPRPLTSNWPPETVGDILAWQSTLDPRCRRKIHERIKEGERKKANGVLIVIESPLMTYGFAVLYDRQSLVQKSKLIDRRDSSYGLKVMPISVVRIDDRYSCPAEHAELKDACREEHRRRWMRHDWRLSVGHACQGWGGDMRRKTHVGGFRLPSPAKHRAPSPGIPGPAVEQSRGYGEGTQALGARRRDSRAARGCQAGPIGRAGPAHRCHRGRIPRALAVRPLSASDAHAFGLDRGAGNGCPCAPEDESI